MPACLGTWKVLSFTGSGPRDGRSTAPNGISMARNTSILDALRFLPGLHPAGEPAFFPTTSRMETRLAQTFWLWTFPCHCSTRENGGEHGTRHGINFPTCADIYLQEPGNAAYGAASCPVLLLVPVIKKRVLQITADPGRTRHRKANVILIMRSSPPSFRTPYPGVIACNSWYLES